MSDRCMAGTRLDGNKPCPKCGATPDKHCPYALSQLEAQNARYRAMVAELRDRGISLPIINDEIEELLEGSGLIEGGNWSDDAADFSCLLKSGLLAILDKYAEDQ